MAGIYKKKQNGTIIVIATIAVSILMILSIYFLNAITTEMKISFSMENAEAAYYLAEAGVSKAMWMLKNDPDWSQYFISLEKNPNIDGEFWSESFSGELENGSYIVNVQNTGIGQAKIISEATVPFLGKNAKRRVEVTVLKAISNPIDYAGVFSGGSGANIDITNTVLTINDGNLFSNHNLDISGNSIISVYDNPETEWNEGQIFSTQNFFLKGSSQIVNYTAICAKNSCSEGCEVCPPEEKEPPMLDFDSYSPSSFYSRALTEQQNGKCALFCDTENDYYQCSSDCIFSSSEFEDLLWEVGSGGTLVLDNKITYITGQIELKGGINLEVKGALIADGSISIGERYRWVKKGKTSEGISNITIHDIPKNRPSGIISKAKIDFGPYSFNKDSVIEGVIYAGNQLTFTSLPKKVEIIGAIMGRKINFNSNWEGIEVTLDNNKIMQGLGYIIEDEIIEPHFSPIIKVDHWEEVY